MRDRMKHVVMFSGGIGSWATARRVINEFGNTDVTLLFSDVAGDRHRCDCGHLDEQHINGRGPCDVKRGEQYCGCTSWKPTTHVGEDEDTYRFITDAVKNLGAQLVTVKDPKGRDIYTVFRDRKWLGNSRTAHCSELLKQKPCMEWLKANAYRNGLCVQCFTQKHSPGRTRCETCHTDYIHRMSKGEI